MIGEYGAGLVLLVGRVSQGHRSGLVDLSDEDVAVKAHLARLFTAQARNAKGGDDGGGDGRGGLDGAAAGSTPTRLPVALPEAAQVELVERAAQRHDWIGRAGRPDRSVVRGTYRRTADFPDSMADPHATPMPRGDGRTHLGYQDHYVVDGDRARIILTALVAPVEVQENQPALDLIWHARFRWQLRPRQVTGDTKYGTIEDITAIEQQRICAYFPLSAVGQRAGRFAQRAFIYDAVADTYRCPGNQTLRLLSYCKDMRRRIHAAAAGVCRTCDLRAQCTTAPRGRRIGRHLNEEYADRVRAYHTTELYANAMRKRQDWAEPLFAEAKDWHGLRHFRLRGLEKVNGKALVIAAGQNLKRLLSHCGWG